MLTRRIDLAPLKYTDGRVEWNKRKLSKKEGYQCG
jgi:hypothetical protein